MYGIGTCVIFRPPILMIELLQDRYPTLNLLAAPLNIFQLAQPTPKAAVSLYARNGPHRGQFPVILLMEMTRQKETPKKEENEEGV